MRGQKVFVWVVALLAALLVLPGVALAQDDADDNGLIIRVDGTVTVGAGEVVDSVVVISGDAIVDGTVTSTLWVIDGTATVRGRVDGDVMVIEGKLNLPAGSTVENVALIRSDLNRDPGATVTGDISERSEFIHFGWGVGIFSMFFWLFSTAMLVIVGLIFAAVAGRRLTVAGRALTERAGESILTALILWIGLPILAILAAITLIGIPIALAIAILIMPVLWALGYAVAGVRLGEALAQATKLSFSPERPYLPVTIGVIAFQVIGLIPFLGGVIVALAGIVGAGALIYRMFSDRRERRERVAVRQEPMPAA